MGLFSFFKKIFKQNQQRKRNASPTRQPVFVELHKGVETELPSHIIEDMPKYYTRDQILNDARRIKESMKILETTTNLDTFLSRYDLILNIILTLKQASQVGIPIALTLDELDDLYSDIESLLNCGLRKSYLHLVDNVNKLKTEKAQLRKLKAFETFLIEKKQYFDFDFNEKDKEVLDDLQRNIKYLEKIIQEKNVKS